MDMMRSFVITVMAACAAAVSAAADTELKVTEVGVSRQDGGITVTMAIDPRDVNPGRDREVVFTPVVVSASGTDSVVMPQIRVAGRNRYYSHLRNGDLAEGEKVWRAGSDEMIRYSHTVAYEPWMERSRVTVLRDMGKCCERPRRRGETPVAVLDFEKPVYSMGRTPRYVALTGDSVIERTAEGRAFVDFVVNRTEIRPDYRGNRKEIAKIIESIDKVKNDPDATITRITIKGYASPEGSYANNVRLAMGRTAALKEYVRKHYNFDQEIMMTDYEPEDWAGLREWVAGCTLPHRQEILRIIDSGMEPDPKDREIKRVYPAEYKEILDSVYPALRHSDYTVRYNIRTYVDIDELKRVFATAPRNLRPVDFQRIASTYAVGSPEYDQVYMKAVEVYPGDVQCNLNAANIVMRRGDLVAAAGYLDRAGDSAQAVFSRGELAALTGDLERAAHLFENAADMGLDAGAEELQRVRALTDRPTVRYLIGPAAMEESKD